MSSQKRIKFPAHPDYSHSDYKPFDTKTYFNNPAFSDIVIKFADRTINAHKIVLCSRSPYFQTALGPDSRFKESEDGVLILHEDDPLAVEAMLTWIYTAKYPEHLFVETDGVPLWKAHLNVMIVADKYDLPALEDLALVKWQNSLGKSRLGVVPLVLQIVARSGDYADRSRRLTSHVAALCDPHFVTLNKHDSFVRWLDQHPGSSKRLVSKHFKELLSVNKFRDRLRDDGTLALEHIDRIMTETESQPKASQQKRRRTTDMAWLS